MYILLALSAAACAGDTDGAPEEVGEVELGLVDPTPIGPDDFLGLVLVEGLDHGTCTGMVIGNDTVLTAAHCVCTVNWVGGNDCVDRAVVTFRDDPKAPGNIEQELGGDAFAHPGYNPSWTEAQVEHDMAIIKLDAVAPAHARPIVVADGFLPPGSTALVAGRGRTGSDCSIPSGPFNLDFATFADYEDGHDIMRFEGDVFCKGDSGGAIMDQDGSRVFGVFSMFSWTGSEKAVSTGSEFDWIKSFMCESSRWNECDGNGDVCGCSASTNIVWRHTNGQVAIWFMEGGTIAGEAYPGGQDPSLSWTIQGTGDFAADGHADILWRHVSGQTAIWFMVDGAIVGQAYPGGQDPSLSWKVQGVGDFDDDGHSDILWRHSGGQLAIWFKGAMAGAAYPGWDNVPAPVDTSWRVQGVGDFDGDAHADILWRHTDGQVAIWFMDGGLRLRDSSPGGVDPSWYWKIQGVGDFDGDLRSDILWRDATGTLAIWFGGEESFDAPSYQNAHGPGDLSWQIQAIGDFDHDRRDDILWRHTSGQVGIWLMDGVRFVGDEYPRLVDGAWQVKGLMRESGM